MNEHTPGPWVVHVPDATNEPIRVGAAGGRTVALVPLHRPEDLGNARLIAAAPALLSSLVDMLGCHLKREWPSRHIVRDMKDAIEMVVLSDDQVRAEQPTDSKEGGAQ